MKQSPTASLEAHFATVSDPRIERTKHHRLMDIITIAICAVIASAASSATGWKQPVACSAARIARRYQASRTCRTEG